MGRRFEVRRNEFAGGSVMGSGNIENFAAFSSPKGATYHSPGQRPGSRSKPHINVQALKGRDNGIRMYGPSTTVCKNLGSIAVEISISPLQGSGSETPVLTQAVGLGCDRSVAPLGLE